MHGPFLGLFNGTTVNNSIQIMATGATNMKLAVYSVQVVNITDSQ